MGHVALLGGQVRPAAAPAAEGGGGGVAGEDNEGVLLRALPDIHHVGQDFPIDVQGPQGLVADILRLGHHDAAHLGPFHVRDVVQPGTGGAPVLAVAHEIDDVRILPGEDVHHAGDGPGSRGVQLHDLRIGIGAVQEPGVEHVGLHIVPTELGDARGHGVREHARQIGLTDDLEVLPQTVYTRIIRHSPDLLEKGGDGPSRLIAI